MASPMISSGNLLPLCSTERVALRDGYAGATARLFIPFLDQGNGYWLASGQIPTFRGATIPQDGSRTLAGVHRPDTFMKDCCTPQV